MQAANEHPLTPLQRELLRSFSMQTVSEHDLREIKIMLSQYFLKKATVEAQKVNEQKGLSNQEIDKLAQAHNRTPYHPEKQFNE